MPDVASTDAVEFSRNGKRRIRVYYVFRGEDKVIRASCCHQDHNWFVRGEAFVTDLGKDNTPITAMRWTEWRIDAARLLSLSGSVPAFWGYVHH